MEAKANSINNKSSRFLLVLNCILVCLGNCGSLTSRLYFTHGGHRLWLKSWLQTAGWPLILIPLLIAYVRRRGAEGSAAAKLVFVTPWLFITAASVGFLTGVVDVLYSFGSSKLPVSTSSVVLASQLGFTTVFSLLIVKLRMTIYSLFAVILLTVGTATLALRSNSDLPDGESTQLYALGFVSIVFSAMVTGLNLPLMELAYMKANQIVSYTLVLEMQLIMTLFATAFCTVGVIINNDFQAIAIEASTSDLGETKYYMVLLCDTILWQFAFLGNIGVVFCASSLTSGILSAVLVPVLDILGIILFHEKFPIEKGVALFLSLSGFASYLFGEMKNSNEEDNLTSKDDMSTHEALLP